MTSTAILEIQNLHTYFNTEGGIIEAVKDISFKVVPGRTVGIVGESGSGKSVTSLSIMNLLAQTAQIPEGTISFLGQNIIEMPERRMRSIRGAEISMIFQEPMTSLNPVFTVGKQVIEALRTHQSISRKQARNRTLELFEEVGIPEPEIRIDSYPHQLSGGQKQRVMIAMALSCNPKLLIADEPTTALDVTIQSQILDLLRDLRDRRNMSILFITHDLGVIAEIADEVVVMYQGRIVEYGEILDVFTDPQHPYTRGLLACRPQLDTPYTRLPTVQDFMEVKREGDVTTILEKKMDSVTEASFRSHGRQRKLHPQQTLKQLHDSVDESHYPQGVTYADPDEKPLLRVNRLKVHFPIRRGLLLRTHGYVKAVDDISFDVYRGQTLGLVGESGCGKTTTGRAILQLIAPTAGTIHLEDQELTQISASEIRLIRQKMQIIFQDPYGSLNPRMTVENTITEPMTLHQIGNSRLDRCDLAVTLLEEVGLSSEHLRRYPHEFSGGQRQRICIARALAVKPQFIICDESVSALDVSVQAQVLNLLNDLQNTRELTYIFISHDLSVVKFMADMIAVMHDGKIVEFGASESIYANPKEDYTRRLIQATPKDDVESLRARVEKRRELREAYDNKP
ncbi:MAG: ABC transporter ATP-binding protein [Planctomycetota bacterium]|nr:ABC transporter ATP-binding protein [Planctomycetota bacterium]